MNAYRCENCGYTIMREIRWYKGKYKVEIILKSKGNYRVRALQNIPIQDLGYHPLSCIIFPKDTEFTTVPRLLWRQARK